ncbi:MAG: hypothetical protein MK132_17610 [Lentisphaerales bacterium]|nr:hypothetical protein [Lentisphaerales bacterium]
MKERTLSRALVKALLKFKEDYFLVAAHLVPSLMALIASLTLASSWLLSATEISTSRVLLLALTTLIPSTFDKARFTFLTQPPQVIFGTDRVAELSAATAVILADSTAITLPLAKSSVLARIIDFIMIYFLTFC